MVKKVFAVSQGSRLSKRAESELKGFCVPVLACQFFFAAVLFAVWPVGSISSGLILPSRKVAAATAWLPRGLAEIARAGVDFKKIQPRITTEDPLAKYPRVIRSEERQARRCMMLMENLWLLDRALDELRDGDAQVHKRSVVIGDGQEVDLQKLVQQSRNLSRALKVDEDIDWNGFEAALTPKRGKLTTLVPYLNYIEFSANLQKIISLLPDLNPLITSEIPALDPPTYKLLTAANLQAGYVIDGSDDPKRVYRLEEDVVMTAANVPITVNVDNVTVDLGGRSIDGNNLSLFGIRVNADYCCVKNGTIKNCTFQTLQTASYGGLRFEDMSLFSASTIGAYIASRGTVKRLFVTGTKGSGAGIRCQTSQIVVMDCTLIDNNNYGIFFYVDGAVPAGQHILKNCLAMYNRTGFAWPVQAPPPEDDNNLAIGCAAILNRQDGFRDPQSSAILANCYARGNGGNYTGVAAYHPSFTPKIATYWDCMDL